MAWTKPGPGRPKGSKNARTVDLEAKLEALGCDPLVFMASVMLDASNPIDLRMKAASELAQYIAPKRKAVEHTGDVSVQSFVIMGATPDATAADWERRNQETMQ
jgi:hypothetical protein